MKRATPCLHHPEALAGWACAHCAADLCPDCVHLHRAYPAELEACARCGGPVERLTIRRSEARPLAAWIPGALAWPFRSGWYIWLVTGALLGAAVPMALVAGMLVPGLATVKAAPFATYAMAVGTVFLFAIQCAVISQTAADPELHHGADIGEALMTLLPMIFRAAAGGVLAWAPAFAWSASGAEGPASALVGWLLLALGALVLPATLAAAASDAPFLQILSPLRVLALARATGHDYLLVAATTLGLALAQVWLFLLAARISLSLFPLVPQVVAGVLVTWPAMAVARLIGIFLHVRGDAMGRGLASDYQVPILPGAVPRGAARPDAATGATNPAAPARAIGGAVRAGDMARAVDLYEDFGGRPEDLAPADLFQVARAAAAGGRHELAAHALRAAARVDGPVAADALLVLGRLLTSKLGRPAEASEVLEELVERFPESDAARHARLALGSDAR